MVDMLLRSGQFFLLILAELVPLFFLVTFISGLALEYISPETLRKNLSGKRGLLGQTIAVGLGYVTPFCSCSTIPVLASMAKAGIPIGVMTAFLCSSPYPVEIALPILAPLFGVPSAFTFLIVGGGLALVSGSVVQRLGWQDQVKVSSTPTMAPVDLVDEDLPDIALSEDRFRDKALRAWQYTLGFARSLLLIIIVSSAVGALIYGFIPEEFIVKYAGGVGLLAVPIAALIGVPLYVNAAAVVPIVYSLSLKGMSQGAVIAFLITATTISPPEILMLTKLFKRKYVFAFAAAMTLGAIFTGYALNVVAN
ncbi:MAG: permease [Anaerolineae bacterium]